MFNVENYKTKVKKKINHVKRFEYDNVGFVHVWCDGAVSRNGGELAVPAVSVWYGHKNSANWCKVVITPALTNNQAEIFAVIRAIEICKSYGIEKIYVHSDSAYVVNLLNEGCLAEENGRIETYKNKEWLNGLRETYIGQIFDKFFKITHTQGHAVDFGNLEADFYAGQIIREYKALKGLMTGFSVQTISKNVRLYVAFYKDIHEKLVDHEAVINASPAAKFKIGDIRSYHKDSHALSQAYYGLSKEFFKRDDGQYKIVKKIGPNAYLVLDLTGDRAPFVVNVRQLRLLRLGSED